MMKIKRFCAYLLACAVFAISHPVPGMAQQHSGVSATGAAQKSTEPNGQHDFDFEIGSWKIHLKRRLDPLTGSNNWVEFDGTSVTRKVWDGRAQLEEFETDGPAAGHIEGSVQSTNSSVEPLLGQQQGWPNLPAPDRRIQKWTR